MNTRGRLKLLFLMLIPMMICSQSLSVRMHNLRVEHGRLYWDMEVKRTDDWGSAYGAALGYADFYMRVNQDGLGNGTPAMTSLHPSLDNARYQLQTGRTSNQEIAWLSVFYDQNQVGANYEPALNTWESLATLSIPVTSPDESSGLSWHITATGVLKSDTQPVTLTRIAPTNITLEDKSLTFTDITSAKLGTLQGGSRATCFADITDDQLPDLYVTQYSGQNRPERFFRNRTDAAWAEEANARGISDLDGGSHGAVFADFDNDGDYDLFNGTTRAQAGGEVKAKNNIFENTGNGYFTEKSVSRISESQQATRGVVALDIEGDGDLDIFTVSGYLGANDPQADQTNELFINEGNWNFTKRTSGAAVNAPAGQGAIALDYDNDGDMDLMAANRTGALNVLCNNGSGQFTAITASGIGITQMAGDGISAGDIDTDGDPDLLLVTDGSGFGHIYKNSGGTFTLSQSLTVQDGYMGGFADLDNDGDLDLVFPAGPCFLNDGSGNFAAGSLLPDLGLDDPRSVAFADMDGDGDPDFAISDSDSGCKLIRNDQTGSNNYLNIKLETPEGQAGAFGAKVRVYTAGTAQLLGYREAGSTQGYLAQNDPLLHFGLGYEISVDVVVDFVDGRRATRKNIGVNQTLPVSSADVMVPVKIFLEGAWPQTGSAMSTLLNGQGLIPLVSPYGDHSGAGAIPPNIVDWVFIELKLNPSGSVIARKAACLRDDGLVVNWDKPYAPVSMNVLAGSYYIIIKHRNHLPVMSAASVSLTSQTSTQYDFTASNQNSYQQSTIELSTGIWGMPAGNADPEDAMIYASDLAAIRKNQSTLSGRYHIADVNLDGVVDQTDYNLAKQNMLSGRYSIVE